MESLLRSVRCFFFSDDELGFLVNPFQHYLAGCSSIRARFWPLAIDRALTYHCFTLLLVVLLHTSIADIKFLELHSLLSHFPLRLVFPFLKYIIIAVLH